MGDPSELDRTGKLLEAMMGGHADRTESFDAVRAALAAGRADVVVELSWYPDGGTHQIVLTQLDGDRIRCFNPAGHKGRSAGEILVDGPFRRRVEQDGSESFLVAELEARFASGKAAALLFQGREADPR